MFRFRLAAMLLALPLLLLGSASAASADPMPQATGWTCDGDICLRYVPDGAVAPLDADGCSVDTCIAVRGSAGSYSAIGSVEEGETYYGHIDLWGPGMEFRNGPEGPNPTVTGSGSGVGAACAQGWAALGGGRYESKGLPCVNVR